MKQSILVTLCIMMLISVFDKCTPDYKNKDPKIRANAVQKINDQALLAKIVFEDNDEFVCNAAVLRITDQSALAKIATEHKMDGVRFTATNCLTDPVALEKIVVNEKEAILLRQLAN
jgi:hypothetical protein